MIMRAIVALPLIFFIPGYVTFNAFKVNKIENLKLSLFEKLFLQVLVSTVITGWIAFTLAVLGYFSLMNLVGFLLAYSLFIAIKFRVKLDLSRFLKPKLDKQSLFLIFLIILASGLFFHPAETFGGFGDSYMYYNQAGIIANHGSIIFNDTFIKTLPETLSIGIIEPLITTSIDFKTGETIIPMFHLYPTWIAIFYSIFGLQGSMYISSFFGVLGILSFYMVIKKYFNFKIAAISSILLSINYIQIWAVREHQSEIFVQFLIFSTFFIFIAFEKSRNTVFGALLIASMGSLFVARIESIFILIPLIAFTLSYNLGDLHAERNYYDHTFVSQWKIKKCHPMHILLFIFIFSLIIYYYNTVVMGYIYDQDPQFTQYFIVLVFVWVLIYLLDIYSIFFTSGLTKKLLQIKKSHIQHTLAVLITSFIIYIFLTTNSDTPIHIGWHNIELLTWYLSYPVLIAGIIGIISMIYSEKRYNSMYLLFGISIIYFMYFISSVRHQQSQPWMMRRFIGIIIPMLYLGVAISIYNLNKITCIKHQKYISTFLVIYLIVTTVSISGIMVNYVELKGNIDQTEALFDSFNDDSILIFADNRYPQIAFPLRYISKKNSFLLPSSRKNFMTYPNNSGDVDNFIKSYDVWSGMGKKVYVVNPSKHFISAFEGKLQLTLYKKGILDFPLLTYEYRKYPIKIRRIVRNMEIYEIRHNNE